jgi:ceramide glucosyltransferase
VGGTCTLIKHLSPEKWSANKIINFVWPKVTILKPLKGIDPNLKENLRSFFELDYPAAVEMLFSVANEKDPAFALVKELMAEYPHFPAQIFLSEKENPREAALLGLNPKLKNLAWSYEVAAFDVILISDSNVRAQKNYLRELTGHLDSKTGMVTSLVAGTDFKSVGGFLEAVYLNTFYARMMAFSNRFAKPCVVGKSMLFRKSTAARFGGLKILSQFLAEDFMAGESMAKLGLKIKTARLPVLQVIGRHSFSDFWKRHLRWGRIRKAHAPLAFFAEPLSNSLFISFFGAFALSQIAHVSFSAVFFASLALWLTLDTLQFTIMANAPISQWLLFPLVWLLREISAVPLWANIASANYVDWRGNRLILAPGGLLVESKK